MSNSIQQLRETLDSVDVLNPARAYERIGEALQELQRIEAARAKDAEVIRQLVDALAETADYGSTYPFVMEALSAAEAQGFKPSDQ